MNKKIIFIIISIVFIVLFVGGGYYLKNNQIIIENKNNIEIQKPVKNNILLILNDCEVLHNPVYKYDCYTEVANINKDKTICDQIPKDNYKYACYIKIATTEKDETICEQIPEGYDNYSCYSDVAIAKKDASLCNKWVLAGKDYVDNANECYKEVAMEDNNIKICDKINDADSEMGGMRDFCIDRVVAYDESNKNLSSCDEKVYSNKGNCYGNVAVNTDNKNLCKQLSDEWDRNSCYLRFGTANKDLSSCELIVDSDYSRMKMTCVDVVLENIDNTDKCTSLIDNYLKDSCYEHLAVKKVDITICENVSADYKNYCIVSVLASKNDVGGCKNMSDISGRNSCYSSIAIKNQDVKLCDNVTPTSREMWIVKDCYSAIALIKNDETICEELQDIHEKNLCLVDFATEGKKDPASICSRVSDKYNDLDYCYQMIVDKGRVIDPKYCDLIKDKSKKINCALHLAEITQDIYLCPRTFSYEEECIKKVGDYSQAEIKCNHVPRDIPSCYGTIGAKVGDINICTRAGNDTEDLINEEVGKVTCYEQFFRSVGLLNDNPCLNLSTEGRDLCHFGFFNYANSMLNSDYCKNISDSNKYFKFKCIENSK